MFWPGIKEKDQYTPFINTVQTLDYGVILSNCLVSLIQPRGFVYILEK